MSEAVETNLELTRRAYALWNGAGVEALVEHVLAPEVEVLRELGLEPLLDLRLRLGEASGAALSVPLIALAARLHAEMQRFDDAGVSRAT